MAARKRKGDSPLDKIRGAVAEALADSISSMAADIRARTAKGGKADKQVKRKRQLICLSVTAFDRLTSGSRAFSQHFNEEGCGSLDCPVHGNYNREVQRQKETEGQKAKVIQLPCTKARERKPAKERNRRSRRKHK